MILRKIERNQRPAVKDVPDIRRLTCKHTRRNGETMVSEVHSTQLPFRHHFGDVFGPFGFEIIIRKIERNQRPAVRDVPDVRRLTRKIHVGQRDDDE